MSKGEKASIIIAVSLTISVLIGLFVHLSYLEQSEQKRDSHNKELLSKIRYGDTYKVTKGLYTDCVFTIQGRSNYYTFSGVVTKCPNFKDYEIGVPGIEINIDDFVPGLETN